MLPSLIKVVEQTLIYLVSNLTKMLIYSQCLVFGVLAWSTISRIDIEMYSWVQFVCGEDFFIEVLAVPPKAGTHAYRFGEFGWSGVSGIAADKPAETAACDAVRSHDSIFEPIILNDRYKFLLNEVQVFISFSTELVACIVGVGVLVVSIVCIPNPHNYDFAHFSL
jgi:hypothetical protein